MDFNDQPGKNTDWGEEYKQMVFAFLIKLSGQSPDADIVLSSWRATFHIAENHLSKLSPQEQHLVQTSQSWLLQHARESFIRQLLQRLAVSPSLYFDLLYTAYLPILRRQVTSLLKSYSISNNEIDDCLQEVFAKIYRHLEIRAAKGMISDLYPLNGWLYAIARSVCVNYQHLHHRQTLLLEQQSDIEETEDHDVFLIPDEYAAMRERDLYLQRCISELPEPCQTCVRLFYFEGLALHEIAQRQQVSLNQVKYYIYQLGLRRLRKLWYKDYDQKERGQHVLP